MEKNKNKNEAMGCWMMMKKLYNFYITFIYINLPHYKKMISTFGCLFHYMLYCYTPCFFSYVQHIFIEHHIENIKKEENIIIEYKNKIPNSYSHVFFRVMLLVSTYQHNITTLFLCCIFIYRRIKRAFMLLCYQKLCTTTTTTTKKLKKKSRNSIFHRVPRFIA